MPLKTLPLGCQHSASTGYVQHASYSTIWVSCTVNDKEVWVSSCHASTSKKKSYIWLLIKIPLSRDGHSSRIKILLARNFRELHVYLSRGPCWPTTPLMKIRSPPAKLRQRITDHSLGSLLKHDPFSGQIFFAKFTGPPPSTCTLTFARSFA